MTKQAKKQKTAKKIICPECGASHFETTMRYRGNMPAHPGMIQMVEPYVTWGWTQPPKDSTAGFGVLECLDCGAALAPSGTLKVIDETD
jgi:hypothetical protein